MPSSKVISGIVLKKRKEDESNPWSAAGYFTVKSTLVLANILILFFGIVVIGIGASIVRTYPFGVPKEVAVALIVIGILIFLIGATGLYGVVSEQGMYLRTYLILISISMIFKIILVAFIMTQKPLINLYFEKLFKSNDNSDIALVRDLEKSYECCGYTFVSNSYKEHCQYTDPCQSKLTATYNKLTWPLGIATCVEGFIMIICLIFISYLIRKQTISQQEIKDAWKKNNTKIQNNYSKFDYA